MTNSPAIGQKGKTVPEMLKDALTLENCQELTYLSYVIQEALRINPPAPSSSHYHFEQDVTLGDNNLKVKAGTPMIILYWELHRSKSQW